MKHASERRLAENEAIFRRANERVVQGIAELSALAAEDRQPEHNPDPKLLNHLLYFSCECSVSECASRIKMTLDDYKRIHKIRDHFIVLPGHEIPEIEKVVSRHEPDYYVVEKIVPIPSVEGLWGPTPP